MKQVTLFFLLITYALSAASQKNDVWIRVYDTTTALSGYKDLSGKMRTPVTFYSSADSFYNIMGVVENHNEKYSTYYLLKDGRKVGFDSVWSIEGEFDCESEGKIKFTNRKTHQVGFLGADGRVVIPAIYDYATPFRNGLAVAHRNGVRKCADGDVDLKNCEHPYWHGGEVVLIDDRNNVLADITPAGRELWDIDWDSKKINDKNIDTSVYVSFRGFNGDIYSFIDNRKEFMKWYTGNFLPALLKKNQEEIINFMYPELVYWVPERGWVSISQSDFLQQMPDRIDIHRFRPDSLRKIHIDSDDLNYLIFDAPHFRSFYTACGEHNKSKYPLFNARVVKYEKRKVPLTEEQKKKWKFSPFDEIYEQVPTDESFSFIRTSEGYKLIAF